MCWYGSKYGSFLLSSGAKGKRCALPNAEIMIHQPLGQTGGQASDIVIAAKRINAQKQKLSEYLAQQTGQTLKRILIDTDRDNFMTSIEAKDYGLIDCILESHGN